MTAVPGAEFPEWIGRSETAIDRLDPRQARLMQVTLDREADLVDGDPLPPMWHYLYFNPELPASRLKDDGHEALGRFLPPVPLPRRMWAGGTLEIDAPLRIGETVEKTSTITGIEWKAGQGGALCFVTVEHCLSVGGQHRLSETQTIVYRGPPAPGAHPPNGGRPPGDATRHGTVTPDPVMLFRYSALIFYGHRIHYDADYARDVEGYPGLVVQGPLTATLLSEFSAKGHPDRAIRRLDIRARAPLFCPASVGLFAQDGPDAVRTWATGPDGSVAMQVDATFATDH